MPKNIGIDLGTTNSCIGYLEGREFQIVPNTEGARVIPSLVALNPDGKRIFGNLAKRQIVTNGANTIWGIKRLMGRKFDSPEVRETKRRVAFAIAAAANGDVQVQLGDRWHSPEEISGIFLGYLREIAEGYLGEAVQEAVITVPAFFDDHQRQATKVAGELAGLNVTRIINEPTAALISYGRRAKKNGLYAVYDLGGGTFDISIVEVNGDIYRVVSSLGDTFLGGGDFDARVCNWIFTEIENETGLDLRDDKEALQRVLQSAEKSKIELSFNEEALISIPYLHHHADGTHYHFQRKLTRSQLEALTADLVDRTVELIETALREINTPAVQIEKIILVGGQSRMPVIATKLAGLFKKPPETGINPEEVVAQGAALQAEIMTGRVRDLLLLDVTPLSLGVETKGDVFTKIIERNSTIPLKKSMVFTTITDNQTTVTVHVLQGERSVASLNKSLGHFNLIGIPLSPKGIPQIEVNFEIDANGIVRASAIDKQTGLMQGMTVNPASGLSPEDIQRLIQEAKFSEEQDRMSIRLTEVKGLLEEELKTVKFYYKRYEEKLTPQEKNDVDNLIARSERAMQGDELALLENLAHKIQSLRHRINSILTSEFER